MQAQSADGVIHDFPDGTNMSVVDSVMKSYAAKGAQPAPDPVADSEGNLIANPEQALKSGAAFAQSALARLSGTDRPPADAGGGVDTVDTRDTIAPGLRSALAPAANTTYGSILPFARDQDTGDVRLALPSSLRDLATGGLDLLEGPTTGTVTPAATSLLANAAISGGLNPSPARSAPTDQLYRPPVTARDVQARDGVGIMEAWRRAHAENTAAYRPAATVADIGNADTIGGAIEAAGKVAESPATETTSAANARGTFETSVTSDDPATRASVLAAGDNAAVVQPAAAGSPFDAQPVAGRRAPTDNYLGPLSDHAPIVYREAAPSEAKFLLPGRATTDMRGDLFFSDNPATALGQGANQGGIQLAFDTSQLQGNVSLSKPGSQFMYENGTAEYVGRNNTQTTYQGALVGVRVPDALDLTRGEGNQVRFGLQELQRRGWTQQATGDGYTEFLPPVEAPVGRQPASAPPTPQSAGAAASREGTAPGVADISTADMKANRRVAEMGEILAPPQANDTMIHVPGSFPTLAEYSADPLLSQYENLLRQRKSDQFIGEGKRLTENNKARVALYDDNTVPDTTLNSMRNDRLARWTAASDDILPNAQPVDLTPVHDWVLEQLSNPRIQENDAVRSVLENFQDRIVDDSGNLKTNPAAVWGIHDNLQNQLAKAKDPLNATGAERFAQSQILKAKGLVDQAMNVATDNRFQSALDNYAEDSKAINAGVLLNDFRPKLTNMSGELQPASFHRFVVNLAKERGDPGIDPSMDISDQSMRALINIDTDLKRAGLIKLGAAAGSPTNLLGALAEKAGLNAAHAIVGKIPGVGGLLSEGAKYFSDRKLIADTAKHLAPPEGGYTYPEPEEPSAPTAPPTPRGGGGPGGTSGPGPLFNAPPTPPPAPPPAPAPVATPVGRATTGAGPGESIAFTPSGQAVAVRYTARDASDLTASQLADGRTNPAFPAALQPRDRTRAASIQQVNSIANRLQPERLGASASTSEGAPIIGPDGAVESGNGRTMAIMQAYADGGPLADAYRQWVADQGHNTTGMQNPVLVRERLGALDMPARARLAADMGASPIAAMSAPERAAADARAIPADILSMYQGGDVTLARNAPFARAFADHVIPPGEHASFMTADGEMSADGAIRMRNALTQHAYGSNSLVTSLAENADPDIKAFGGALMDASGDMAKLRGAIDSGAVSRASDIAPDIVAAAQLIQTAKRQRISLADAVGQRDAFSALPEKTEDILQAAFGDNYAGRMSRARMADLLTAFAQEAQMQSGLFGANLTAGEMLAEARAKYGYGTNKAGAKGRPGISVGNGPGLDLNGP
jgi:ddrB-like ParB superfamily domain